MNGFWITFIGISFIFLMTALGSGLVFCFKKEIPKGINALFFGVASGVMLASAVWSLLLPAFDQAEKEWGRYAFIPVILGFLCGGALLDLIEKILHRQKFAPKSATAQLSRKLFFAVTLHNIPEGLAVGFAFGVAASIGTVAAYLSALGLAVGIGVQNFPEGAAVALPLQTTKRKTEAFCFGVASGAVEPIFAVVGYFFSRSLRLLQPWLLALSAGSMIYVAIDELLPLSKLEESSLGVWGGMFGFTIMMFFDTVFG